MKRALAFLVPALVGVILLSSNAFGTMLDFRDATIYSEADEKNGFKVNNIVGNLDIEFVPSPETARLYWDNTDGFGVRYGYEEDEVEYPELLKITFSETIYLSDILITDLFENETRSNHTYDETGWYALNLDFGLIEDTDMVWFAAGNYPWVNETNGEFFLPINDFVDSIVLSAPGGTISGEDHEFSVAGAEVAQSPEPTTLLLLGSGLVGLVGLRRKFKKQ